MNGLFLGGVLWYNGSTMDKYNYNYNYHYNGGSGSNSPGPGPGGKKPQGSDPLESLTWIIDVLLIFVYFPVGLGLTIAHSLGFDVLGKILRGMRGNSYRKTGESRARYTTPTAGESRARYTTPTAEPAAQRQSASQSQPARRQGVRRADTGAKTMSVFGWILIAFGLLSLLSIAGSTSLWNLLTAVAVTLGGGTLLYAGGAGRKKEAKFKSLLNVTGTNGLVKMQHVSRTLGIDMTQTDRLLSEMIDRGYYGPRAYLDRERKLLVIDPEEMRDVFKAEDEAKKTKAETKAKADQTEYERIIAEIRQADMDIADEEMSEKIRKMQSITAAIFREVEAHPEKKSQIRRFMDYYLPTTLKLLNSYARIEAQGVSGENMAKAKADIERIADTLVEGYEKQLDTLYQAEAVDIAGDVSVIENMMRRDGLTGGSDFGVPLGGH